MKPIFLFIILLTSASLICCASNQVSCAYPELSTNEMVTAESCGVISNDGLFIINKDIIEKINWNKDGTECAYVYGTKNYDGWYNIIRSGVGRISPFWPDNSCEPFPFGIAVGLIKGKVIFYNRDLKVVKHTSYDWASGFERGYSKVCKGVLEKVYDSYGDHFEYKGGTCGYIDANFKIIVPLNYSFENTPKPKKP
jgi:hypothetical protein